MSTATYARIELRRTFRNRRFFAFALGFPVVLYFVIAGSQKGQALDNTGLSAPLYFMASMASWGAMLAMISTGARIAVERQVGWNRQLRITPLSPRTYLATKVVLGYVTAIASLVVMYLSGTILGVSLPASTWLRMTGLLLVGLLPFAALGVLIGHLVRSDSVGPLMGGGVALLALVSGTWFPLPQHGTLYEIGRELPSYWLVQAGRVAEGGTAWPLHAWVVVGAWTVLLSIAAAAAYRRDTARA